MQKNTKYIITGIATAAGAAGAFFGMRVLINRKRRAVSDQEYQERTQRRMRRTERGTQQGESGSQSSPSQRRVATPPVGTRYQPQDQPDRQPIPSTGMTGTPVPATERAPEMISGPAEVETLTGPLIQYLLGFSDMIEQLRARRRDGIGQGGRSLQPGDRAHFQETLDRLENQLADFDEGGLADGSLEERMYLLALKVRDALQNLSYDDDDLFRINGEVRIEACKVLAEIQPADADLIRARQAYQCAED